MNSVRAIARVLALYEEVALWETVYELKFIVTLHCIAGFG